MPFTQNGFYNDPSLGQSFANIASMFAPPSIQDQAAAAAMRQSTAQVAAAQAAAQQKAAAIADVGKKYGQSVADLYTAGVGNAPEQAMQLDLRNQALANPNNPAALDTGVYALSHNAGSTFAGKQMDPLSADQTRINPPSVAASLGVPQQQVGLVKTGVRATLFPNGQVPPASASSAPDADDSDPDPQGTAIKTALGFGAGATAPSPAAGPKSAYDPGTFAIANALGATPAAAAPSPPDNGVSTAPNGVTTISEPDKPDTMDSMQAAAFAKLSPADQRTYLMSKGGGQTINVGPDKNIDSYGAGAIKSVADQHYALANGVGAAQSQLRDINAMSGALDRIQAAGGTTGLGTAEKTKLQGVINTGAAALGLPEPFDIDDPQVITKFNRTLAGAQAKDVGGARVTNFEMNNFLQSNPGLDLTPNANRTLLGIQGQIAQRNVDLGSSIRQYYAQSTRAKQQPDAAHVEDMISAYDAAHHIVDPVSGQDLTLNPTLGGAGTGAAPAGGNQNAGPAQITSVDDYNALPSGAQFIAPGETAVRTKR